MLHPLLNEDILKTICNYLEPEETRVLIQVCKTLNLHAKSPVIWQKYLSRLKNMDMSIHTLQSPGESEDWCYKRFVAGFEKISKDLQQQINDFLDFFNSVGFIEEGIFINFCDSSCINLQNFKEATNLKMLEDQYDELQKYQRQKEKLERLSDFYCGAVSPPISSSIQVKTSSPLDCMQTIRSSLLEIQPPDHILHAYKNTLYQDEQAKQENQENMDCQEESVEKTLPIKKKRARENDENPSKRHRTNTP